MRRRLGSLTKDVAIYGAGDVAVAAVSFLLLPLYLRHLSQEDYGALAILIGVEALAKIVYRFGLDGAFMRFYVDRDDADARARLASTLCLFLLGASSVLLAAGLLASSAAARHLFPAFPDQYVTPLRLVLTNTFLLTFTFVPFHVMRMRGEAGAYASVMFARSLAILLLRLLLVVGMGRGLTGLMIADLVVTLSLMPVLWPWARPLLRADFSPQVLAACLRFGLPRLPHGLAQQLLDAGNKYLLNRFVPLKSLGVYQISATIGQSLKFFLSAFETGWAPFYYQTAKQPAAPEIFAKIATYGIAVLALLVAGLAAVAPDLVRAITFTSPWTDEAYASAALVIPLIALGIAWQGVYLLTSIGLNLSGHTVYYPVSTFAAVAVGLGSGVLLMPPYGAAGAAVAFVLSYVTLALTAGVFSQRCYPVRYESGRIARVLVAALLGFGVARLWPDLTPLTGLVLRGATTVAVFGLLLYTMGFLRPTERALLRGVGQYLFGRSTPLRRG